MLQASWVQRIRAFSLLCGAALQRQLAAVETQQQLLVWGAPLGAPSFPSDSPASEDGGVTRGPPGGPPWKLWASLSKLLLQQKQALLMLQQQLQQAAATLALFCCSLQQVVLRCTNTQQQQPQQQHAAKMQQKGNHGAAVAAAGEAAAGAAAAAGCCCCWRAECLLRACDFSWALLEKHLAVCCSNLFSSFSSSVDAALAEAPLSPRAPLPEGPPLYQQGHPAASAATASAAAEEGGPQRGTGFIVMRSTARAARMHWGASPGTKKTAEREETPAAATAAAAAAAGIGDSLPQMGPSAADWAPLPPPATTTPPPAAASSSSPQHLYTSAPRRAPRAAAAAAATAATAAAAKPRQQQHWRSVSCEVVWRLPSRDGADRGGPLAAYPAQGGPQGGSERPSGPHQLPAGDIPPAATASGAPTATMEPSGPPSEDGCAAACPTGDREEEAPASKSAAAEAAAAADAAAEAAGGASGSGRQRDRLGPPPAECLMRPPKLGALQIWSGNQLSLQQPTWLPLMPFISYKQSISSSSSSGEDLSLQRLHQLAAAAVRAMRGALGEVPIHPSSWEPLQSVSFTETADVGALVSSALLNRSCTLQLQRRWSEAFSPSTGGCCRGHCPRCVLSPYRRPNRASNGGPNETCSCCDGTCPVALSRVRSLSASSGAIAGERAPQWGPLGAPLGGPSCPLDCLRLPTVLQLALRDILAGLTGEGPPRGPQQVGAPLGSHGEESVCSPCETEGPSGGCFMHGAPPSARNANETPATKDERFCCCLFPPPLCSEMWPLAHKGQQEGDKGRLITLPEGALCGAPPLGPPCMSGSPGRVPQGGPSGGPQWPFAATPDERDCMRAVLEAPTEGTDPHIQINEVGDGQTHAVTLFFAAQVGGWLL